MDHSSELALHVFLSKLTEGTTEISEVAVEQITTDVRAALVKQFRGGPRGAFRIRMSNIGRPYCQLWYQKNKPELAEQKPYSFVLNMMMGDIVEAIFKGLLTSSGVQYEGAEDVALPLPNGDVINGTTDLSINGAIDDIKSASPWSYTNKFESFATLDASDAFGYVGQLVGYARAAGKEVGGWWVVNKANGQFKYVSAFGVDEERVYTEMADKVTQLDKNEFERCYEPVDELFRSKPTGNRVLTSTCKFCDFKKDCWPTLQTRASIPSSARNPPIVDYIHIEE